MPDPTRPQNDPVMHPDAEQPRNKDREAEGGGTGLAVLGTLGCLGFSLFPWLVAGFIILILVVLGVVVQSCTYGH